MVEHSNDSKVGTSSTPNLCTMALSGRSDSSTAGPIIRLDLNQATPANNAELGQIFFGTTSDTSNSRGAQIAAIRDGGTWSGSSKPTRLTFSTTDDGASTPTERLCITSTGQVRLAGAGITFNGDTAAANELDDYEEGTWTPSVGGNATYTEREGNYVKIGKLVYIRCSMTINLIGTGSATTLSGLPFTCFTTTAGTGGHINIGTYSGLAVNSIFVAGYVGGNTTSIIFTNSSSSGASMTNSPAIFGNSARVDFTLMYQI